VVLPEFLPFFMQSDIFMDRAEQISVGSLSPTVNWGALRQQIFSIPPLEEQRRLAAMLHAFDGVDAGHWAAQESAETLATAYLSNALFGRPDRDAPSSPAALVRGWSWSTLKDVVSDTKSGLFMPKDSYGAGHNIVGVADLYRHRAIAGQTFGLVPAGPLEVREYALQEGDLIYGESSLVREGIARTLPVTASGVGTIFAWHTRRVRVNRAKVWPFFLSSYLNSPGGRRSIMARATTTVLTGMTVGDFLTIPIPIGPLEIQRRIQADLEEIWSSQRILESRSVEAREMARAFAKTALEPVV
jgi:hypothetical protein